MGNNMPSASRRTTDTIIVKNVSQIVPFLIMLKIIGFLPLTLPIVVQLPPNTAWPHLVDTFREMGDITAVDMQGKDTGLIKFNNDWEAERAVSILYNRQHQT